MDFTHSDFITSHIPHRDPFLWLDRVVALGDGEIVCEKEIDADLALFQGHYPDYPLMPGVILCEAVFQAGALLISVLLKDTTVEEAPSQGVPVLTRIISAKFKRQVRPCDVIEIQVALKEKLSNAWFMKGSICVAGKVVLKVDFACTLATDIR